MEDKLRELNDCRMSRSRSISAHKFRDYWSTKLPEKSFRERELESNFFCIVCVNAERWARRSRMDDVGAIESRPDSSRDVNTIPERSAAAMEQSA